MIWTPDTRWSEDVIEECAAFPYGDHDDLVDSMTQAVMRFRQGNFLRLKDDYVDDPTPKIQKEYY
jgi:phage terminase large subunit-like protein